MRLFGFGLWILGFLTYVHGARLDNIRDEIEHAIPDMEGETVPGANTTKLVHTDKDIPKHTNTLTPLQLDDSMETKLKNILEDNEQSLNDIIPDSIKDSISPDNMKDTYGINNMLPNSKPETNDEHIPNKEEVPEFNNNDMDSIQEADDMVHNAADSHDNLPDNFLSSFYEEEEEGKEDGLRCSLRQTMAWRECEKKVACDYTCKTATDCTFPYCNSLGLCECTPVFCKTDRMCHFFRIECHGNFTCRNSNCYCD